MINCLLERNKLLIRVQRVTYLFYLRNLQLYKIKDILLIVLMCTLINIHKFFLYIAINVHISDVINHRYIPMFSLTAH